MTNLLLTVLDKVGVDVDTIGDSTGRLSPVHPVGRRTAQTAHGQVLPGQSRR